MADMSFLLLLFSLSDKSSFSTEVCHYLLNRQVVWGIGLILAVDNMLGDWMAARMAVGRGAAFVREERLGGAAKYVGLSEEETRQSSAEYPGFALLNPAYGLHLRRKRGPKDLGHGHPFACGLGYW